MLTAHQVERLTSNLAKTGYSTQHPKCSSSHQCLQRVQCTTATSVSKMLIAVKKADQDV